MSDRAHIHFSSLEHAEHERLVKLEGGTTERLLRTNKGGASSSAAPPPPPAEAPPPGVVELSGSSQPAIAHQPELKESIPKRKRARELAVPTHDNQVKLTLRDSGAPICLGEQAPERPGSTLDEPDVERSGALTHDRR